MAHPVTLLEAKQAAPARASRIPAGGRVLHPRAGAQPPAAAPGAPTSGKIQPHLQNLPKFQPPKFENINGVLPCPDSPGSTPREDAEEDALPAIPSSVPSMRGGQMECGSNLSTSAGEPDGCHVAPVATLQPSAPDFPSHAPPSDPQAWAGGMSEVTLQDFKKEVRCVTKEEAPLPVSKPKRSSRAPPKEVDGGAPMHSSRQHHQQHAIGSFVEYRSRSSGAWLLARVEGYDEKTQTYRLDVQPHAAAERVRPRQSPLEKIDQQRTEAPARSIGSRSCGQEATGSVAAPPPRQPASEQPAAINEPASPRKELQAGSKLKRSSRDTDGAAVHSSRQHHQQTVHAIGSFVEYRSRSSGAWLLARVEGYDEKSQTYRLDVQPHAAAERVRPRQTALDKVDQGMEANPPTRSIGSQWSDHEAAASGPPPTAQPSIELPAPTAEPSSPRKEPPVASRPKRSSRVSKEMDSAPVQSSRLHHQPAIHAIGSYVEYRSTRASGAWLLARVEGYDEKTQTYRLDVQPVAAAERVRPRQSLPDKVDQGVEAPIPGRSLGSRRSHSGQEAGSISAPLSQPLAELTAHTAEPSSPRKELQRGSGQTELSSIASQSRLPSAGSFVALPPQVWESQGSLPATAAPVAAPPAPSGVRPYAQTKSFAMVPRAGGNYCASNTWQTRT